MGTAQVVHGGAGGRGMGGVDGAFGGSGVEGVLRECGCLWKVEVGAEGIWFADLLLDHSRFSQMTW